VRGTTATFVAATSHPTNRFDTSLQCESGHLYVVQLTAADTIDLGDEGSQSAGAPRPCTATAARPDRDHRGVARLQKGLRVRLSG
jgi:hypothetical protein